MIWEKLWNHTQERLPERQVGELLQRLSQPFLPA
jgi:hypothetical protein